MRRRQGRGQREARLPARGDARADDRAGGGKTARFSFRASRTGTFRFVCLVPGHEEARMWDVLKIVAHGKPSVVDLQARS